ncbi:ATP-binding Cassette (ABC) superfamily, partial [Thraustotheca clavata]
VGLSGSGKSTIVALLERFYEPTSGKILLDGRNISKLQLKWLRSQIGLVSQEPILFATTIFENIASGGNDISKEDVIAASKLANAHNFIMQLPDQYDTMCGEKGVTLSGGQKQRVAIARALIRKSKILVLDEATSALDNESERVVQAALNDMMDKTKMTTLVIAHRLSTIRNADKIIVLSEGSVVELGSHSQLMKLSGGLYKKLVEFQERPTSETFISTELSAKQVEGTNTIVRKYSVASNQHTTVNAEASEPIEADIKEVSIAQIMALTKPQRPYLIAGFTACLFQGFSMPVVALIIANVMSVMQKNYNLYLTTNDRQYLDTLYTDAREQSIIFLGIAVVIFLVSYVQTYSFRLIGEKLTTRLRNMYFQAIIRQNIGFFDQDGHTTGALTTDLSTNVTKVVAIAGENQSRIVQTIFTLVGALIISFSTGSWQLTLVMLCVIPLVIGATMYRSRRMKGQNITDSLKFSGSLATEAIVNVRTVSAFGLQESLVTKYDTLLTTPMQEGIRQAHFNGFINGVATFSTFAVYALIFWYGNKLIVDKSIDFQEMIRTLMTVLMAAQGMGQTAGWIGDSDA